MNANKRYIEQDIQRDKGVLRKGKENWYYGSTLEEHQDQGWCLPSDHPPSLEGWVLAQILLPEQTNEYNKVLLKVFCDK